MSQSDAATVAGLATSTWRNAEAGRSRLTSETRERIEEALEWAPGTIRKLAAGETSPNGNLIARIERIEAHIDVLETVVLMLLDNATNAEQAKRILERQRKKRT